MEMIGPEHISYRTPRSNARLTIQGELTHVTIEEVGLKGADFPFALLALSCAYPRQILGYSGFTRTGPLVSTSPSLLELRMQKTDDAFYSCGIASTLLDEARSLARERGQTLILEPNRPNTHYPLTTEQLKDMYLRHGFREFTPEEHSQWSDALFEERLTHELWFNGFDPQAHRWTRKKRYSMSHEDKATLSHISLAEKRRLVARRWSQNPPGFATIESQEQHYQRTVGKYLVARDP